MQNDFYKLDDLEMYIRESEILSDNEKNRRLLHYFPWLLPTDFMGNPIDMTEMIDSGDIWTSLDDFPVGWRKAFGWDMVVELDNEIRESNLNEFGILQIKEKYGTLHFYNYGGNDKTYQIVDKYEDLSAKVCVNCGKPATKVSTGWICPWCDECAKKINGRLVPIEDWLSGKESMIWG